MDFNFTERLIYHRFQMSIRATLCLSSVPFKRLHELLKFAAYSELKAYGVQNRDIATHLKCAPRYVLKLSGLYEPEGTDTMSLLFVVILEILARDPSYTLGQSELHERVFRGNFDPLEELGGTEVEPSDDKDFERSIRYLERRGVLEECSPFRYRLTKLGQRYVERDLSRPYLRKTQRLTTLLKLASYLQAQDTGLTRQQLVTAVDVDELELPISELNSALDWCHKQLAADRSFYIELNLEGILPVYSVPTDEWLTPNERSEDKQLTLLTLVDELKEFTEWVCMDPPHEQVAVFALRFRVLPEKLGALLSSHKKHTMDLICEPERDAERRSEAIQYSLSWLGRVLAMFLAVFALSPLYAGAYDGSLPNATQSQQSGADLRDSESDLAPIHLTSPIDTENIKRYLDQRTGELEVLIANANYAKAREQAKEISDWAKQYGEGAIGTALMLSGAVELHAGSYAPAVDFLTEASDLLEPVSNEWTVQYIETLNALGLSQLNNSQFIEAEETLNSALEVGRRLVGQDRVHLSKTQVRLGWLLFDQGKLTESIAQYEQALQTLKQTFPDDETQLTYALNGLANATKELGRFDEAESYFLQIIDIFERGNGASPADYATILTNFAQLLTSTGRYEEAIERHKQCIQIRHDVLPPEHPDHGVVLANLAVTYTEMSRYSDAIPLLHRSLAHFKRTVGENHNIVASVIGLLGTAYSLNQQYPDAQIYLNRSVELALTHTKAPSLSVVTTIVNLGTTYERLGQYDQATEQLLRAKKLHEQLLGGDSMFLPGILANLGAINFAAGRYTQAADYTRNSLELIEQQHTQKHTQYATTLNSLGKILQAQGLFIEAERATQRSLEIQRSIFGPTHLSVARSLIALGNVYFDQGLLEAARTAYHAAINALIKLDASEKRDIASAQHMLAATLLLQGDYIKAAELCIQARATQLALVGPNHPSIAAILQTQAAIHLAQNQLASASTKIEQAVAILQQSTAAQNRQLLEARIRHARIQAARGQLDEAHMILDTVEATVLTVLGEFHPTYQRLLRIRAIVFQQQHQYHRAASTLNQALEMSLDVWYGSSAAMTTPELWKQSQSILRSSSALLCLPEGVSELIAFEASLRRKGLTLEQESMRRQTWRSNPALNPHFSAYQEAVGDFSALAMRQPPSAISGDLLQAWYKRKRQQEESTWQRVLQLQTQISQNNRDFDKLVSHRQLEMTQLSSTLNATQAIIDFVVYDCSALQDSGTPSTTQQIDAFVLLADGTVRRHRLGDWSAIKSNLDHWLQTFVGEHRQLSASIRYHHQDQVEKALLPFLEPIIQDEGLTAVLISPDRELARVPWSLLRTGNNALPLQSEVDISIVPVPRILLTNSQAEVPTPYDAGTNKLFVVGNVEYGTIPKSIGWTLHPAMKIESSTIAQLFNDHLPDISVELLEGTSASKNAFLSGAAEARWIHVASHAYSKRGVDYVEKHNGWQTLLTPIHPKPVGRPPELNVGLVLAGANLQETELHENGLLSAWELATADLSGVELAVLAACSTADGVTDSGKATLGLQRALQVGGVASSVTSLWPVDDISTLVFFEKFYEELLEDEANSSEALNHTQRWLRSPEGMAVLSERGILQLDTAGQLHPSVWAGWVVSLGHLPPG